MAEMVSTLLLSGTRCSPFSKFVIININMFNIIQRAISGNTPSKPHKIERQVQLPSLYLSLELVEENATFDPFATTTELEPGKTYALQVWATPEKQAGQTAMTVGSQLELFLQSSEETVKIDKAHCDAIQCHLNRDQPLHTFSLQVAEECPKAEITFKMAYRKINSQERCKILSLKTILAGNDVLPTQAKLSECGIPDKQLNEKTAILQIQKDNIKIETLRIQGWKSCQYISLDRNLAYEGEISLGKLVDEVIAKKESYQKIRNKIRSFFRREPQLINWLLQLKQSYQDKFTLIIVDYTATEQPWEMIELGEDCYLGAYANVVRWTCLFDMGKQHQLEINENIKMGHILYYLDNNVTKPEEKQLLNGLATIGCRDKEELKQHINTPSKKISLIYLAGHGSFDDFDDQNPDKLILFANTLNSLELYEFEGLTKWEEVRPIFFVNTCHSARLIERKSKLYGFPEITLIRIASGYIGTMAKVNSDYAAKMAQKLLHNAHTEPKGINIAERLKHIRREVVKPLKTNPNENDWKAFINTFLYVYYGNPFARLKLKPAQTS
jgi:hypothetical protein